MGDGCYNFFIEHRDVCETRQREPGACRAGRSNCKFVKYGVTGEPISTAATWTPRTLITCRNGTRKYFGSFLVNTEGMIIARARENLQDSRNNKGSYRIYTPPVCLNDAVDSELHNYSVREDLITTQLAEVQKAVEDKIKEEGVYNVAKQSKIVKTYAGPNGTLRYRNVKTGQFVKKS
jgi:hypothetical protein